MSGFAGLNNARRALAAQLKGMEVAGQNIANANTPGYSRQVANHSTIVLDVNLAVQPGENVLGLAGVEVAEIKRQYDGFLDARLRELTANNSETSTRFDSLSRLEELMHEPGDATIGTALEDLWTSFAQLTTNPRNEASRNNVLYRANAVAETLNDTAQEMTSLQQEAAERALRDVERINALVNSLVGVNERLVSSSAGADGFTTPNALLDKRDALLRELSQYANVDVTELNSGTVRVTLAGRTLLDGVLSVNVDLSTGPDGALAASVANQKIPDKALGGMLGGELQAHNTDLPHYKQLLDDLAVGLIDQVNSVHSSGYDAAGNAGTELFTGTSATNIRLAANMKNAPFKLAVSQNVDGTDGYIAQRLADLRETPASGEHSLSFQYAALVSELGSNSSSLKVSRDNNQALVDYAEARSEAVSGVSLDEELTDIIRYQQAYSAAARVLTSIDEALDILINRTGQVGR